MALSFLDISGLRYLWNKINSIKSNKPIVCNYTVATSDWVEDSNPPNSEYPYRADIVDTNIKEGRHVTVSLSSDTFRNFWDESIGISAYSQTYDGGKASIYVDKIPSFDCSLEYVINDVVYG